MWSPEVTVVLPLFGDHRAARTLPAVCRAWLRQDVPCEVVVAVAGGTAVPPLAEGADGRVRVVPADARSASPGPLRNLAVEASRAPLLYLSDADIAPVGADFLAGALRLREGRVVAQPWMYRLVNADDLVDVWQFEPPGRRRVCHVSGDPEGRLTPVPDERLLRFGDDVLVAEPPPGAGWLDQHGRPYRLPAFHWGGVLVERKLFEAVGRYSRRYVGWGCEDDDLLAKLEGRAQVVRAWRAARWLTCVHFEHSRAHTPAPFATNQPILAERLAAGAEAMIKEDLQ